MPERARARRPPGAGEARGQVTRHARAPELERAEPAVAGRDHDAAERARDFVDEQCRANGGGAHGVLVPRNRCRANVKKRPSLSARALELPRQRPTLPRRYQRSTIGPGGLNFRVRDGNGCGPSGNATGNRMAIDYVAPRVQPSTLTSSGLDMYECNVVKPHGRLVPLG